MEAVMALFQDNHMVILVITVTTVLLQGHETDRTIIILLLPSTIILPYKASALAQAWIRSGTTTTSHCHHHGTLIHRAPATALAPSLGVLSFLSFLLFPPTPSDPYPLQIHIPIVTTTTTTATTRSCSGLMPHFPQQLSPNHILIGNLV